MERSAPVYRFADFQVEPLKARLLKGESEVPLEPRAFQVLLFLLHHRDRLVSKQELLDAVWSDAVVTENALTRAVTRLRRALDDDPRRPRFVGTAHTRGYRFLAPVEVVSSAGPARRPTRWLLPISALAAGLVAATLLPPTRDGADAALGAPDGDQRLDTRRVAVLPIADLSGTTEGEQLAGGLTEHLISVLSRIDGVRTVPRTSVMAYRDSPLRVSEIGRELGVGTVLEGSLGGDGEQLAITVRLVDVVREESLWSKEIHFSLIDFFGIQRDVALRVGEALHAQVSSVDLLRIARGPTREEEAYEHYLRGRASYRQLDRAGNERAVEHYRMALELDPDFSLALAGLADALGTRVIRFGAPAEVESERATAAARRALQLDPELPEAWKALGVIEFGRSRIASALEHVRRALELAPDYDEALFLASLFSYELGHLDDSLLLSLRSSRPTPESRAEHAFRLWELGFTEEALASCEEQLREDPLGLRLGIYLANREMLEGRLEAARVQLERLSRAHGNSGWLWRTIGEVESRLGNEVAALGHFEHAASFEEVRDAELGLRVARLLRRAGRQAEAEPILARVEEAAEGEIAKGSEWSRDRWKLAAASAVRGDADRAVSWYAHAVDAGHRAHYRDRGDPLFAEIRDDPRFVAQLQRMRADIAKRRARVLRELGPDPARSLRRLAAGRLPPAGLP